MFYLPLIRQIKHLYYTGKFDVKYIYIYYSSKISTQIMYYFIASLNGRLIIIIINNTYSISYQIRYLHNLYPLYPFV